MISLPNCSRPDRNRAHRVHQRPARIILAMRLRVPSPRSRSAAPSPALSVACLPCCVDQPDRCRGKQLPPPTRRNPQSFRPIKERLDGGRVPRRTSTGRRLAHFLEHAAHLLQGDARTCSPHRGNQDRQAVVHPSSRRPFQDGLRQESLGDIGLGCTHQALQRPAPGLRKTRIDD